ncbi:MAG: hypothetical protein MJ113_02270 [Lachnospiraceae bacterium]|nr:hypothetical protein [Lachnospiraceae bacterium]
MSESTDKKYINLLPYEISAFDNFVIYDNAPFIDYHRRRSFLTAETINKESKNVVKYYSINTLEPVKIGGEEMVDVVAELKNNSGPKIIRIA